MLNNPQVLVPLLDFSRIELSSFRVVVWSNGDGEWMWILFIIKRKRFEFLEFKITILKYKSEKRKKILFNV